MTIGSFEEYVESLSQLSNPFDPTVPTAESDEIRTVAAGLVALGGVDRRSLAAFIQREPDAVPVLGMAVGLTREKLKNVLRHHLGSSGWITQDLRRIYDLRATNQIDGLYTLEGLGQFRQDLEAAAKRLGLIP